MTYILSIGYAFADKENPNRIESQDTWYERINV